MTQQDTFLKFKALFPICKWGCHPAFSARMTASSYFIVVFSQYNYFKLTSAPSASNLAFISSASALETPSLTTLGAPSTTSLASFNPSPVISRTTLITLTLDAPAETNSTSNSSFSSAAPAPSPAAAATNYNTCCCRNTKFFFTSFY